MALVCKQTPDIKISQETQTLTKGEDVVVCRICHTVLTRPSHRTAVGGAFSHTFANPHGHVFEIGCFSQGEGCVSVSGPSSEFTWFPGYSWQIAACSGCGVHIGWIFSRDRKDLEGLMRFLGLILDKLIFP